jgi:hypothetical protein
MGWSNASGWMTGAGGWNVAAGAGASPVLFTYNFLTSPSLPATMSLSRATTATRFDSSGVIQTAAIDAARFDNSYNGSSWVAAGLLVEEQRTNYITDYRQELGIWQHPTGSITVGTGVAGIDGTNDAYSLTPGTSNASYLHYHFGDLTSTASPTTSSFYVKPNGYSKVAIRHGSSGSNSTFDMSGAGSIIGNVTLSSITAVGSIVQAGSWYRPVTVFTPSGSVNNNIQILILETAFSGFAGDIFTGHTWTPNGTSGVIEVFPQIEIGAFPTSVIVPITFGATTRSADVLSATGTLATQLAAGPSVWELQDQATGAITRASFAAGAFTFPTSKWYRSFGVYPFGTNTAPYLTVGGSY